MGLRAFSCSVSSQWFFTQVAICRDNAVATMNNDSGNNGWIEGWKRGWVTLGWTWLCGQEVQDEVVDTVNYTVVDKVCLVKFMNIAVHPLSLKLKFLEESKKHTQNVFCVIVIKKEKRSDSIHVWLTAVSVVYFCAHSMEWLLHRVALLLHCSLTWAAVHCVPSLLHKHLMNFDPFFIHLKLPVGFSSCCCCVTKDRNYGIGLIATIFAVYWSALQTFSLMNVTITVTIYNCLASLQASISANGWESGEIQIKISFGIKWRNCKGYEKIFLLVFVCISRVVVYLHATV